MILESIIGALIWAYTDMVLRIGAYPNRHSEKHNVRVPSCMEYMHECGNHIQHEGCMWLRTSALVLHTAQVVV